VKNNGDLREGAMAVAVWSLLIGGAALLAVPDVNPNETVRDWAAFWIPVWVAGVVCVAILLAWRLKGRPGPRTEEGR